MPKAKRAQPIVRASKPPRPAGGAAPLVHAKPKPNKNRSDGNASSHGDCIPRSQHHRSEPRDPSQPAPWRCASIIDQQAARAVTRLLHADATRTQGATVKSLTLAPHIEHKRATFAVTVETLKYLPLLRPLVDGEGLLGDHPRLTPATAYVLAYELLLGQGFGQGRKARADGCG